MAITDARVAHTWRVAEDMTVYTAARQRGELSQALRGGAILAELDLTDVGEIDTAGLQLLLIARKAASGSATTLRLVNARSTVRDVLHLLRLDQMFEFVTRTPDELPVSSGETP